MPCATDVEDSRYVIEVSVAVDCRDIKTTLVPCHVPLISRTSDGHDWFQNDSFISFTIHFDDWHFAELSVMLRFEKKIFDLMKLTDHLKAHESRPSEMICSHETYSPKIG